MKKCAAVRRPDSARRGVVAVMVAVSLLVLLGALGFAVDGGYMFEKKHQLTAVAEASAMAGANLMFTNHSDWSGLDPTGRVAAIAKEYAAANGFKDGSRTQVNVNIPPKSGEFAGVTGYIEVIVEHELPRSFSSVLSREPTKVSGRAVAAGTYVPTKASVILLEPDKKDALKIKGASMKLKGDLIVNSTNKNAVKVEKKGQIQADNVTVSGGISRKSKGNLDVEGDFTTAAEPSDDPLKDLPIPEKGPERKIDDYLTEADGRKYYTLEPGHYSGKIEFKKDAVVKFKPGVYTFDGEVKFRDNVDVSGSEVMLYTEGKKSFKFETKGSVSLSPPKSGPYAGVTLFADRDAKSKIYFKNDMDLAISGTIYAPNSEVKFQRISGDLGFIDEDDEGEEDLELIEDDLWQPHESTGSINAQLIARKLSIDKKSHIVMQGAGIDTTRPFLGIVE